jgi:hydrogenase maturation protease
LDRYDVPAGVAVLDGGTLGLSLLPYFDMAESVILVDAVRTDALPGTLVRIDGDEVAPAVAHRLSPHQVGVADLLDGARLLGRYPKHVVLLGLVPASIELGVGLSPMVHAALGELVDAVVQEARELGFVFEPRDGDEMPPRDRTADVAHLAGLR